MLRSCLVRSRGLGLYSTRACPSAFQLDWSRGFAGNAKGDEEKSPEQIYVDEQRTKEAEMLLKTQTLDGKFCLARVKWNKNGLTWPVC
mmetsp:Transcript_10155/g.22126  ORF Transcript_10155/g.22126 Transcript_10155/m.22126 type:complete len:88 (+) Transcript_10155:49-312(+)